MESDVLGIEQQLSSLQSAELGVLTTTLLAHVMQRWNISTADTTPLFTDNKVTLPSPKALTYILK
jgi:hypothetical protein